MILGVTLGVTIRLILNHILYTQRTECQPNLGIAETIAKNLCNPYNCVGSFQMIGAGLIRGTLRNIEPLERYIERLPRLRLSREYLEVTPMMSDSDSLQSDQEWFDRGKEDAWAGKSKQPPEHDPQAASLYDLGYSEGEVERPPNSKPIADTEKS